MNTFASRSGVDKSVVVAKVVRLIDELWETTPEDEQEAEASVLVVVFSIGRLLLAALIARHCWQRAMVEIEERGSTPEDVRFRLDQDYWGQLKTALGTVRFPRFAFRQRTSGLWTTRTPSVGSFLPTLGKCRSSRTLLKLEVALGSRVPFRQAEGLLSLVTHGEVTLHDTTIAAHCVTVASALDRRWFYESPRAIKKILKTRAILDTATGKPLVFVSSDAHAERFYEGETWQRGWKMVNALRIYTLDRRTHELIHLGGEFIVGDCHAVGAVIDDLNDRGILPFDALWRGRGSKPVAAQIVFIADGMPWFDDYIVNRFPEVEVMLDAYHVLERIGKLLAVLFRKGTKKAKDAYRRLCLIVTGRSPSTKDASNKKRRGTMRPKKSKPKLRSHDKSRAFPAVDVAAAQSIEIPPNSASTLVLAIAELPAKTKKRQEAIDDLLAYLMQRYDRICYAEAWHRGWVLSSAPIESFHRIAQGRLKLPGATWVPETAQAILNLRLLHAMGRDKEFWADKEATGAVAAAFRKAA